MGDLTKSNAKAIVSRFFNSKHSGSLGSVTPDQVDIHIGLYFAYDKDWKKLPEKAKAWRRPRAAGKVKFGDVEKRFRYVMAYHKRPYKALHMNAFEIWQFDPTTFPGDFRHWKLPDLKNFHFQALNMRADVRNDSTREMKRCHFKYAVHVGGGTYYDKKEKKQKVYYQGMSSSAREQFRRPLAEIDFVPPGMEPGNLVYKKDPKTGRTTLSTSNGMDFKKELGRHCTYQATGKGEWFPKWKKWNVRKHAADNYHKQFIHRQLKEIELERGQIYCLRMSRRKLFIYLLHDSKKEIPRGGGARAIYAQPVYWRHGESAVPPSEEDSQLEREKFIFFVTRAGTGRRRGRITLPRYRYYDAQKRAYRILCDPRREVFRVLGKKSGRKLHKQLWRRHRRPIREKEWFFELIKLQFMEDFYPIPIESFHEQAKVGAMSPWVNLEGTWNKIHGHLRGELDAWARQSAGRKKAYAQLSKMLSDKDTLILPQGMTIYGKVKFVGADSSFCYLRDVEKGVTLKETHRATVLTLVTSHKLMVVYKATRGVIPFAQIVVWGSLVGMGVAAAPGLLATGQLVRKIAVDRIRKLARDQAVRYAIKRALPYLVAKIVEGVASLFGASNWAAFSRGFAHGYVYETLHKVFVVNIKGIQKSVFREYYLYQNIKRAYNVGNRVSDLLHKVHDHIGQKEREELQKNLKNGAVHILRGVALILTAIYHVEQGKADPFVKGLGGGKPSDWEKERKAHLLALVDKMGTEFESRISKVDAAVVKAANISEFIGKNDKALAGLTTAAIAGLAAGGAAFAKYAVSTKAFWVVVIAGVGAGGVVLHKQTKGASTKKIGEILLNLLEKIVDAFPGSPESQAEVNGQLVGNLVGGIVLDSSLFSKKKFAGGWSYGSKHVDRARRKMKHGVVVPILKLLLHRYVHFYRQYVDSDGPKKKVEQILIDLTGPAQGDPRLTKKFNKFASTNRKGLALKDLALGLLNLRKFLDDEIQTAWKKKYGGDVSQFSKELKYFKKDAEALGLDALAKRFGPLLAHQFLIHMRLAVDSLIRGLEAFFDEVGEAYDGVTSLSIAGLLEILGVDVGNAKSVEAVFERAARPRLDMFKPETS